MLELGLAPTTLLSQSYVDYFGEYRQIERSKSMGNVICIF